MTGVQTCALPILMLGHFSKRYNGDEELLLTEAREVFPDTILAKEGLKVELI